MTRGGRLVIVFMLAACAALPALADSQDDRLTQLEQKLNDLLQQAQELQQQIRELRGATAPAAAGAAAAAPVATDDLTQIDVAQPAAPAAAAQPTETAPAPAEVPLTAVQPVENSSSGGAAKALNPDISAIGNFVGHAGDNPEARAPFTTSEVELALEAFIDPYAKGKFFLSFADGAVDVEEGYAQFVALPWGLSAKAGKTKATFGKANTWHTHVRPWIDEPLMITRFFGEEGLADTGISVSKPIDNPWNTYVEATGEVYSGEVEHVFGRAADNDLFYNAHLRAFRDLTENSNLEIGTSWARGTMAPGVDETLSPGAHNQFHGVDVTYRWKPLSRSIYNSFIGRFEGLANRRSGSPDTLYGYYASGDYQFAQRWYTGVRLDRADWMSPSGRETDRGLSATLTFWPSEFSQIRGQYRRTMLGLGPSFNEFLLQLQFSIGAHGAHTF